MSRELEIIFQDKFRNYSDKLEEVENIIRKSEELSQNFETVDFDSTVQITWNSSRFVNENMGGAHGKTLRPDLIEFKLNTRVEKWKKFLKSQYIHEYSHTIFTKRVGFEYETNIVNWRHILLEAHGQLFSEKVFPDFKAEWRTKHSKEEISENWNKYRDLMGEKIKSHSILNYEFYPPWLGYSLAYHIGNQLLNNGNSLKNLPELGKSDVINAGNEVFGKRK